MAAESSAECARPSVSLSQAENIMNKRDKVDGHERDLKQRAEKVNGL